MGGKKPEGGNNGASDEQEQRKSLSESDTSTASNNVTTTTTTNESTTKQGNKLLFKVPPHTPIVFSESNGRTIFRLLCQDASGKAESNHLRDTAPPWVIQTVTENKISSQFLKLSFFLQPHPSSGLKPVKSTNSKLLATDMLTIGKVCDHVRDKILSTTTNGDDASQSSSSQTVESATQDKSEAGDSSTQTNKDTSYEQSSITENKVELLCNDQVLNTEWNLRTVKHVIWKSGADLILHYRLKP